MRVWIGVCIAAALAGLSSCEPSDRYWQAYDLPREGAWQPAENVVFEFTTMAGRGDRIELFVRTEARRGEAPLRLIVKTMRTDGLFWQDTVLVRPKATWGAVYEARSVVRQGVAWRSWAPLSIGVRPADGALEGVLGVGFMIDGAVRKNY